MATINDLVLVHVDEKPGFYARIDDISPDVKQGWWQVKLLVLTFPLQVFTWILDESQIEGAGFTMGGTPLRLEKLAAPYEDQPSDQPRDPGPASGGGDRKVVSLADRRKK